MRVPWLWLLLLTACGEVSSTGDDLAPDGASGRRLVASTPADGATGVSVLTAIELDFDGPIELDGLGVYEGASRRDLPLDDIAWDEAASQLVLTLARPLDYAASYRVEVAGETIWFQTRVNAAVTARSAVSRIDHVVDADGWPSRTVSYDAGPDGVYGSADDTIRSHAVSHHDQARLVRRDFFYAPGADGTWFTDDDPLRDYEAYQHGPAGQTAYLYVDGPGPDAQWHTADDPSPYRWDTTYDALDRRATDTVWRDGALDWWSERTYDGDRVTVRTYDADDVLLFVDTIQLDGLGRGFRRIVQDLDGSTRGYHETRYDPVTRLPVSVTWYTDPGADGAWFTADDPARGVTSTTYQGDLRAREERVDDAGNLAWVVEYDLDH